MTDDELDDPKNIHCCKCDCNILEVLVIVNKEWICAGCIEKKINSLTKQLKDLCDNNIESIENRENNIFLTLLRLYSLIVSNHPGTESTYRSIGEVLVGKDLFNIFYDKFNKKEGG